VIDARAVPVRAIHWPGARRIIRSLYPPIDLFEDIAGQCEDQWPPGSWP
jgi:hypothetical protein